MHNRHAAFTPPCTPDGAMSLSHAGCEALLAGTFGSSYAHELGEGGIFADKRITQLRGELADLDWESFPQPLVDRYQPIDAFRLAQAVRDAE